MKLPSHGLGRDDYRDTDDTVDGEHGLDVTSSQDLGYNIVYPVHQLGDSSMAEGAHRPNRVRILGETGAENGTGQVRACAWVQLPLGEKACLEQKRQR